MRRTEGNHYGNAPALVTSPWPFVKDSRVIRQALATGVGFRGF
jgi:hypothetical protein